MKRLYALAALLGVAQMSVAHEADVDSTKLKELDEVVVKAVKAPQNAPFAVSKIDRKELELFSRTGQELPFLMARTPGIMAWSENGLGTGTSYMRIRGAADSRINVTLDGVALNSPEDQCVFWANMNSYGAFLGSAQIQRGVGTSTNGDGAFGGTVALQTQFPDTRPALDLSMSYGMYNTMNYGGRFSSGLLLKDHLVIDGAWHETRTDGYIHGTAGRSGSYYGTLTYINTQGTLKLSYKNIGNYEHTGQAWNGVTAGDNRSYKELCAAGLGRYNSLCESLVTDADGTTRTERYRMADGSPWDKTTDNFWHNHSLLNLSWRIDPHWSTSATLRYTRGSGYYEEFRPQNKLFKFGLSDLTLSDGTTLKKTDFVRQKGLTQHHYGLVWNVNYQDDRWDVQGGLALLQFEGNHYGYLTYAANEELRQSILAQGRWQYYDSDAWKGDQSAFLKANFHITKQLAAFADVQYRYVNYRTNGINDKFVSNGDGTYTNQRLDIDQRYHFANPKLGLSYKQGGHSAYLSYAMGNREPERNNFTDNGSYPAPKAERVHDLEAGYGFTGSRWHAGLGLYAMLYRNQFVQTGALSDIGETLTTNIRRSRRMGVELTAGVDVTKWFSLEANAAVSQNRILDFDEVASVDWEATFRTIHHGHSTLAFSPSAILNAFMDFHWKGLQATWHTGYVSKQYLDNTACDQRSLPAYTRTDLSLAYDLRCGKKGLKHTIFGLNLNNLFNARYAQSGWVYSSILTDASGTIDPHNRYTEKGYIPSAGFTLMGSVTVKF